MIRLFSTFIPTMKEKMNDLLAKNPNIAFEMDCNHELYYRESNMSCNFRYESVVGTGRVEIVLEEEKEKALTLFNEPLSSGISKILNPNSYI